MVITCTLFACMPQDFESFLLFLEFHSKGKALKTKTILGLKLSNTMGHNAISR